MHGRPGSTDGARKKEPSSRFLTFGSFGEIVGRLTLDFFEQILEVPKRFCGIPVFGMFHVATISGSRNDIETVEVRVAYYHCAVTL